MHEKDNPALQALHQGIQTELQGLTFYRKAAEHTSDPKGKQVLQSLAHEEVEHLHLLKVQYGALASDGQWGGRCPGCPSRVRGRRFLPGNTGSLSRSIG